MQMMNQTGSQSAEYKPLGQEEQQLHQINIQAASTSMGSTNYMVPPENLQGFYLIIPPQMMAHFPWQHFINQVLATHQGASNGNLVTRTEEDLTKPMQMLNETGSQSASTSESGQDQQSHQINIRAASTSTLQPWNDYNLPRSVLLSGDRDNYVNIGVPLYEASIRCDWNAAKAIIEKNPEMQLVRCSITENNETALHVAASLKRSNKQVGNFVKNLVALMTNEDLKLENSDGDTALLLAAVAGNIQAVKIMVHKNSELLTIPGSNGMMPLIVAAMHGNYNVVKFLYGCSRLLFAADRWNQDNRGWNHGNRGWLLQKCVEADMFDVALEIVKNHRRLGRLGSGSIVESGNILGALARKPYAFSVRKPNIIKRIMSPGKRVYSNSAP